MRRITLCLILLTVLGAQNLNLHAQSDPPDAAAAQAVIEALGALDAYERYTLTVNEYTELDARLYPSGAGQNDNQGRIINITRTVTNAVDLPARAVQRHVHVLIEGDRIEGARLIGLEETLEADVLALAGAIYVRERSEEGGAWRVLNATAAPPDLDWWLDALGLMALRAFLADDARIPSRIGDLPQQLLRTPEDILTRVDEIRVQAGRTAGPNGRAVTFYRLLGDGLADVVAHTAPLPIPDADALALVEASIQDVSLAVVVDEDGRLITRIINYNIALVDADAALFGLVAGRYSLRGAVNIVEQYSAIDQPQALPDAPPID